jgi:C-terminal peptidase prc
MKKAMKAAWLAGLVLTLAAPTLRAADNPVSPRAHVVLVGISTYADTHLKPRPHAEADVKALYDLLTDKKYLGVDRDHVQLLLGSPDAGRHSRPATRAGILEALRKVAADARPDDLVLITFIGEGGSLGERGDRTCYFASDSTLKGRDKDALAAADVGQELDKVKSRRVCVFLDVNFKGFDSGKESVAEVSLEDKPYREFLGDDGTEEHAPLPGRIIFMATNGLSASLDLEDHGVFARVLLDGLGGAADKEGYEPDGLITADELSTYVNKEMPELLRRHGKTDKEKGQAHFIVRGHSTRYVLTTNPEPLAKAKERLAKFERVAKDQSLPADLAEEGKQFLSRMPRLEAQRNLRKEYQKLADGDLSLADFREHRTAILDGMQLPRGSAREFARTVIAATRILDREYVKEINQGELVAWAVQGVYRRLDEKVPDEIKKRLAVAKALSEDDLLKLLTEVRERLGKREDLDKHKDIDHALQRMLAHLDPYTTYIDPETLARFEQEIKGQFSGVGMQIRKDAATDLLQVVTPIKGSPAYKGGVLAGDLITTVVRDVDSDGLRLDKTEVLSTKGVPLPDLVKKILGKPGTKVKLIIRREGEKDPVEVKLEREVIEVESVFGFRRNKDDGWDYLIDRPNKIAYVRLHSFQQKTAADLSAVLDDLERQGVRGLVLDLRFNPGGLLPSARDVADLFIDDGPIVSIRQPRAGHEFRMEGRKGGHLDLPVVCLVNGDSASASEIVSACLQDRSRAKVAGERSYGKGSVQTIHAFDGGEIKVTTASFWRPSGKNLNKSSTGGKDEDEWGVTPDKGLRLELPRKERDDLAEHLHNSEIIPRRDRPAKAGKSDFKDRQLELALEHLRNQIKEAARSPNR